MSFLTDVEFSLNGLTQIIVTTIDTYTSFLNNTFVESTNDNTKVEVRYSNVKSSKDHDIPITIERDAHTRTHTHDGKSWKST